MLTRQLELFTLVARTAARNWEFVLFNISLILCLISVEYFWSRYVLIHYVSLRYQKLLYIEIRIVYVFWCNASTRGEGYSLHSVLWIVCCSFITFNILGFFKSCSTPHIYILKKRFGPLQNHYMKHWCRHSPKTFNSIVVSTLKTSSFFYIFFKTAKYYCLSYSLSFFQKYFNIKSDVLCLFPKRYLCNIPSRLHFRWSIQIELIEGFAIWNLIDLTLSEHTW